MSANCEPRWIRCYDNGGKTADRYIVVFTKGKRVYLSMNREPFHPQGIGMHGEWNKGENSIDRPTYGHLGKKIAFNQLPEDCQKLVRQDYSAMWDKVR